MTRTGRTGTTRPGEAEFRRLIESSPVAHFVARASGDFGISYVSSGVRGQLGYEPEQFTQDPAFWASHVHPDDRPAIFASLEQLVENEECIFEYRFLHSEGDYRWALSRLVLVRDQASDSPEIIGTWVDVTKRKETEQALQRAREQLEDRVEERTALLQLSEARLKETQRIASVGSWDLDILNNELWWSDETYRIFGFGAHEFEPSYEAFLSRVHPDDRKIVGNAVERSLRDREPYSIDYRIVLPDGTQKIVHAQAEVFRDEGGRPIRMTGSTLDITERARVESALRESERKYRTIVDTAHEGIWLIDANSQVSYVNGRIAQMLDYAPEEMLGQPVFDFLATSVHEDARHLRTRLEAGARESFEFLLRRKDGSEIVVGISASPVTDDAGQYVGSLGMISDLSERQRLQSQLQQSQKMEAVGQLTGGIAHDFNNLLAVILGNLELLDEPLKQNEALHASVESALDAGFRGAELTRRLLAFSRQQQLAPVVVDVNDLVAGIEPLLKRTLGEVITLGVQGAEDLWLTEIDTSQLENSLVNLALNARDAMPRGGTLMIKTSNSAIEEPYVGSDGEIPAGEYVLVAVSDTGTGMPKETLEKIFEPFFTTKEFGRGSGLGLSMVHGFVAQSGGHIAIESKEGRGTTFSLYLPRCRSAAQTRGTTPPVEHTGIPAGQETILIVDDEAAVRQIATKLLGSLGYRVLEARDGADAQAVLDEHDDIDLLFTDIVMPVGMSGVELARRALERNPRLKVIYTSGYTATDVLDKEQLGSNQRVLNKPYRREELAAALREALNQTS